MSYLVLARKFRPQSFASIVGQQHITTALANTIKRDRVPHALLFTGPRGVGKTTAARIFARALNCSNLKEAEPCGECVNCKEINTGSNLSVWEIDGASNNSVDNVRELIDSLRSLPPPGSKYKIYIIDEVHMLSTAAFNALLKSLEEPPANTVFIFATTDPQKIPETVISRCQRYDFTRLTKTEIVASLAGILQQEGLQADADVLDFLARKADGGLRDAQSMLDRTLIFSEGKLVLNQVLALFGAVDRGFYFDLGQAVLSQDTATCLSLIESAFSRSLDIKEFISEFVVFWRNALVFSFGQESANKEDQVLFEAITSKVSKFDLQRIFDLAEETANKALRSAYPRYVFEAGVIRMATISNLLPLIELLKADGIKSASPSVARPVVQANIKPVVTKQVVSKSILTVEARSTTQDAPEFNPSWEEFLNFLNRQGFIRLQAYLRRVRPSEFRSGLLKLEAVEFDLSALRDAELLSQLKSALTTYGSDNEVSDNEVSDNDGSVQNWDVQLVMLDSGANAPGSEVEKEQEQTKKRRQQIAKDAKEDPVLKEVLSTFEGSHVEKVSILKS